ncbi:MAG: putative signal-transduction protein containing cAMP-binding and CBS domain protein [Haloquadratum walsbyi J07HQW1]|uniref:Putative signal-transduction protein containing cAMP-binding and CBS domain protein n=1 Tax=Haloquadratum walsbyi J07HQW1 TaxID=1238424 RepID=U1PGA3_9EURY|nr:MAG: putative signal-transduction protein containing cAMP-binding and CBS domain protein [Haloquadratum walsbyi J07HQW1]
MTPSLTQSVTELMTTPVHSVNADTSVADAAEILLDENIGSVIVKDPAGILTKTDLVSGIRADENLEKTTVAELMTQPVISVTSVATVQQAVDKMETHNIKRIAVEHKHEQDENHEEPFVGIISVSDLTGALSESHETAIGMYVGLASANSPYMYECVECGNRITSDHQPEACPECGGQTRNLSVSRD